MVSCGSVQWVLGPEVLQTACDQCANALKGVKVIQMPDSRNGHLLVHHFGCSGRHSVYTDHYVVFFVIAGLEVLRHCAGDRNSRVHNQAPPWTLMPLYCD